MADFDREIKVAVEIATEAGVIMLKYFDAEQGVEIKADNTQVTIADKTINSLVIKRLNVAFPDDGIIGEEESTTEYGGGRKWICDPIDGTAAFIWGVPTAMFSLALVVDGKPVVGVAFDPFLNKLYVGRKGEKSTCNGKNISVSSLNLESGTVAVTSGKSIPTSKSCLRLIEDKVRLASIYGAVAKSVLLARGKFVGYIEERVNPHDIAAVHCIVEGAGGKVTSLTGNTLDYTRPFKGAILSNGVVHDRLVEYCN